MIKLIYDVIFLVKNIINTHNGFKIRKWGRKKERAIKIWKTHLKPTSIPQTSNILLFLFDSLTKNWR